MCAFRVPEHTVIAVMAPAFASTKRHFADTNHAAAAHAAEQKLCSAEPVSLSMSFFTFATHLRVILPAFSIA